jgi:hypothetical protein
MEKNTIIMFVVALFVFRQNGLSQGFVNLNFEAAQLSAYGSGPALVPTNNAIPGWIASFPNPDYGAQQSATIAYDTVSIGGAAIIIFDTNSLSYAPIQGRYSILLQGEYRPGLNTGNAAEIAQTGLVPVTAQSLIFWGSFGGDMLLFNNQIVSYAAVGSGNNYTIYQADISEFAGQTGTLGFLAPVNGGAILDNIQFSSTSVPEPSMFALAALGGLLLGFRRRKK